MRLQAAIPIDAVEGSTDFSGFEGPEEREARRARRKARRLARKRRRLSRLRAKTADLRKKAGLPRKKKKAKAKPPTPPSLRPATPGRPEQDWQDRGQQNEEWPDEPQLEPADWDDSDPQVIDADWSETEPDEDMEGMGAFRPFKKIAQAKPFAKIKAKAQARRQARQVPGPAGWGPNVRMGRHLRIQAAAGHRAAVIDLKPGLFLVAEVPEAVTRAEFGFIPLLAPLMIRAAKKSIDEPEQPRERRGPLAALFRRRQSEDGRPFRMFRAREAQAAPALPGPVAEPATAGPSFMLPAPNVGWAEDHDVAEVLGCEACVETWR